MKIYERELAAKKEQDAAFRNICKEARSDLGENGIKMIKAHLALKDEKKAAKWKAEMEAFVQVARWNGEPIGFQGDLWGDVDRRPAGERAFDEGKEAGLAGATAKPPEHFSGEMRSEWLRGHAAGQGVLIGGIKQKPDDADSASVH